jgi:hypothetical protein
MAFQLQVRFTGLCAIIPESDIYQPRNEATVVLVNAKQSFHGPHRSLLLFDPESFLDGPNRRQAPSFFQYEGVLQQACSLDGEALTVLGRDKDGGPIQLDRNSLRFTTGLRPNPPQPCPENTDLRDFTWVCKNPGAIDTNILSSMDYGDLIAARIRLTAGTFSTDKFRTSSQGRIRWWFDAPEPTAIAEEVVWEVDFPDSVEGITIISAPFQGYLQQRSLFLKPKAGFIKISIVNMPLADVLALDPARRFDPDHHFEEFYRLCIWTPSTAVPVPDLTSFCGIPSAASNPKCPPTLFASTPLQASVQALSKPVIGALAPPDVPSGAQAGVSCPPAQASPPQEAVKPPSASMHGAHGGQR